MVLTQPVHVQSVPAAAGGRIVEREAQIISTEKPFERAARFRNPEHVARGVIRFDAGGNRHLGFDGLLVEDRAFLAARIKPIRSNGPERLVEFEDMIDLFDFVHLNDEIRQILKNRVDLVTRIRLSPISSQRS